MLYRIFDDMTQCNEQEVARLLPLVSAQRREQALGYKHTFGQYCCLQSYKMLCDLLAEWGRAHHTPLHSTLYTLHPTLLNQKNTHMWAFTCVCAFFFVILQRIL